MIPILYFVTKWYPVLWVSNISFAKLIDVSDSFHERVNKRVQDKFLDLSNSDILRGINFWALHLDLGSKKLY